MLRRESPEAVILIEWVYLYVFPNIRLEKHPALQFLKTFIQAPWAVCMGDVVDALILALGVAYLDASSL